MYRRDQLQELSNMKYQTRLGFTVERHNALTACTSRASLRYFIYHNRSCLFSAFCNLLLALFFFGALKNAARPSSLHLTDVVFTSILRKWPQVRMFRCMPSKLSISIEKEGYVYTVTGSFFLVYFKSTCPA